MTKKKVLGDHSSCSYNKCLVCGDIARGFNFNVMTCMPCKTFFRKNAFKQSNIFCEFKNDCIITKITRSYCSPCRLKKCLTLGMDPTLIRVIPHTKTISNKTRKLKRTEKKQMLLPTPLPLNLLRNDQSTLTSNEWTLLSNFIHTFDEQNLIIRIQSLLNQLASLPPKLRLRPSDTYGMISQFFTVIQSIIEHSPDAKSLSHHACRALTKNNLHTTGAINGIFLCRELDLYNNPFFRNPCNIHYGSEYMIECIRNSARCDPNGTLIKIMLFVMSFSSNCSIVTFNEHEPLIMKSSSIDLISIQNVYITLLWKYLIYLYGFKDTVIRFSYIVKNIIDIIHMLELMPTNEVHNLMIETIATETERALLIND